MFELLAAVSQGGDHVLSVDHMADIGLDPIQDRLFMANLALLHGFDVTVQRGRDVSCPFNCV